MDIINPNAVKKFYDLHEQMWDINDWYKYSQKRIISYIQKQNYPTNSRILNAGSGGNSYGIISKMTHLDISPNKLKNISNTIVANIEDVELPTESFDTIICVGSVINYCNSYRVLEKFSCWLACGGELILEFENSGSFEYAFSQSFNKSISIVTTQYIEDEHTIYIYSLKYILNLLMSNNLEIEEIIGFHIISSFLLKLGLSENIASKLAFLDKFLGKLSFFKKHAANIIIKCKKSKA
ncbi:MAG: methyltransferase domain-containing protein [Peptoanaerobacter stomatis]|uniref:methyltransferase domain-containing protein n=1 Tax=Peptoanaerobacter stomatis TaxID=796937 RepID=UPI003FA17657